MLEPTLERLPIRFRLGEHESGTLIHHLRTHSDPDGDRPSPPLPWVHDLHLP